MKTFEELTVLATQWAEERNFYGEGGSTLHAQALKLGEEGLELVYGLRDDEPELVWDSVGDMLVVLNNICNLSGFNLAELRLGVTSFNPTESGKLLEILPVRIMQIQTYFVKNKLGNSLKNEISLLTQSLDMAAKLYGKTSEECFELAYNEIKDRQGKFINGSYVKESDL